MLFLFLTMLINPAFADDDKKAGTKVTYKQRTEIDFESLSIEGELVKPQGSLVLVRKRGSFNPLIELRWNFDEEISKSVDNIK